MRFLVKPQPIFHRFGKCAGSIHDPTDVTAPSGEGEKNQKRYQVPFLGLVQGSQWKVLFDAILSTLNNNNQRQRTGEHLGLNRWHPTPNPRRLVVPGTRRAYWP